MSATQCHEMVMATFLCDDNPWIRQAGTDGRVIRRSHNGRQELAKCWGDLITLIRLVCAYINGKYIVVPLETIIWAILAIIYFVNPFDLIPDFIPGFGYVDDAAAIAFVVASIRNDLENFREWEKSVR